MKKSVRLTIQGSIQPVFFNNFIKGNAEKYSIKGFVRNKGDGIVEIFVEGNIDDVTAMLIACKTGPQHSMIRSTQEKEEKYQGFKDFRVMDF
ncbi:MAG: acylphosphatase [Nanoarchaeota archaeon]